MKSFWNFIKEIRQGSWLNQEEFAKTLGVSKILIAMVESWQKSASKDLVWKLSEVLEIWKYTLFPFIDEENYQIESLSLVEKMMLENMEKVRDYILSKRVRKITDKHDELSRI